MRRGWHSTGEQKRRAYRELIVMTPGRAECIDGAILCNETIRQRTMGGTRFVDVLIGAGIMPGIKTDMGTPDLAGRPGDKVSGGLDGLHARLQDYRQMSTKFTERRVALALVSNVPSRGCIAANAHALLARNAAPCEEARLVPVVEPEVLMTGENTVARCRDVTEEVLLGALDQLQRQPVLLEGMLPGLDCHGQGVQANSAGSPASIVPGSRRRYAKLALTSW